MKDESIIDRLAAQRVQVWREDGKLRYRAPSEVMTPALFAEIRASKSELLSQVPDAEPSPDAEGLSVGTAGATPASIGQHQLWFLEQLEGPSAAYNVPVAFELAGPLDVAALEGAVNDLIGRHEVLRTTFSFQAGELTQVIAPVLSVRLGLERQVDANDAQIKAWLDNGASIPFDLSRGPLVRVDLLETGPSHHIFRLVLHHIIADGWSLGVIYRELSLLYNARCANESATLEPLSVQFADYASWQQHWNAGDRPGEQIDYWRSQLAGIRPTLDLPSDGRHRADRDRSSGHVVTVLPEDVAKSMRQLAASRGCTLYNLALATFSVLLHRYSGQNDIVVGTPMVGRGARGLDNTIGFFVNAVAMRTQIQPHESFEALLGRVRADTWGALTHHELPFEKVVEMLSANRDHTRAPVFQVLLGHERSLQNELALAEVKTTPLPVSTGVAKFELIASVVENGTEVRVEFEFSLALFDKTRIERLGRHLVTLFESVIARPDALVSELSLLGATEHKHMLEIGRGPTWIPPAEPNLSALFEVQVRQHPTAVAIGARDSSLTYAELDDRANAIAQRLWALGVNKESLVGICLERSVELVIGLLGIIKAGAAYVPLDPTYPEARLAWMLADSDARVVVTDTSRCHNVVFRNVSTVSIDRESEGVLEPALEPDSRPCSVNAPDDLAYVMYTSGTTGAPKGVMVAHRAVARLVKHSNYLSVGPDDVVGQVSNASFDAYTFELWGALLNGARLEVIEQSEVVSPHGLSDALKRARVTILFLTTALFERVVEAEPACLSRLRCLLFGGEKVNPAAVHELQTCGMPGELLHVYGPTESTTFATAHSIPVGQRFDECVPIGHAIAGTDALVLDSNGRAVPIGVPGELYLGGAGLARGYLGQPTLTAEKFVAHPFSTESGEKLYRTGDMVRYRGDGALEFLGRLDQQIKLRGHRIEPAEIEQTLGSFAEIGQSIVVLREDVPDKQQLVAYVTASHGQQLDRDMLHEQLRLQLPSYMIPQMLVVQNQLPVNANGKVDRSALPVPGPKDRLGSKEFVAPRDLIENAIALIWRSLLGVQHLSINEDFFCVGGHSLLAVQLVDQIEEKLGVRIPLDSLWSNGATIAHLSSRIQANGDRPEAAHLVVLRGGASEHALFCIHTMGGAALYHYEQVVNALPDDCLVYGIIAKGVEDGAGPNRSIEAMASHCIEAMRAVQPAGPYHLCGYSSAGVIAYEMARQLRASGAQVAPLMLIDAIAHALPRHRKEWARSIVSSVRQRKWRDLQELTYYVVLTGLGLKHLRALRSLGECHRWAYWNYRPRGYGGDVVLIEAMDTGRLCARPNLGWADIVGPGLKTHLIPGDHRAMIKEKAGEVGCLLATYLERSRHSSCGREH